MTIPGLPELAGHYRRLFEEHGDDPRASQWSPEGQRFRLAKLLEIGDLTGCSVLDLGCGLGAMYPLLRDRFPGIRYEGIDLVPEAVAFAGGKYPDARFRVVNLLEETILERYDYVLSSGVFNNAMAEGSFLEPLLERAWEVTLRGLGFNFISTHVNQTQPEMAYHDPAAVLDFCLRRLSRRATLQHHYERCDVAVFVYR
jgi:SAM-dependent methyltransferase